MVSFVEVGSIFRFGRKTYEIKIKIVLINCVSFENCKYLQKGILSVFLTTKSINVSLPNVSIKEVFTYAFN